MTGKEHLLHAVMLACYLDELWHRVTVLELPFIKMSEQSSALSALHNVSPSESGLN